MCTCVCVHVCVYAYAYFVCIYMCTKVYKFCSNWGTSILPLFCLCKCMEQFCVMRVFADCIKIHKFYCFFYEERMVVEKVYFLCPPPFSPIFYVVYFNWFCSLTCGFCLCYCDVCSICHMFIFFWWDNEVILNLVTTVYHVGHNHQDEPKLIK